MRFSKREIRRFLDPHWMEDRVEEYLTALFGQKDTITLEDLVICSFTDHGAAVAYLESLQG